MPEDESEILTPLQQDTFELQPKFQKRLTLLDKVSWVFSILMGRYRGKQVPIACNANDALMVASDAADIPDLTTAAISADKNGTRDLIAAPGAGKQLWIHGMMVTGSAEGTAYFGDDTPIAMTGLNRIAANGGFTIPVSPHGNQPIFKCGTNKKFQVTLSADTDLDGWISYRIVSV